jgi:putative ABC transport system permease protein
VTDWTIVTRSLRVRLFSSATTVITVAVAVSLLLVLLMMRDAGSKAFERGTGNMHLLVSRDQSALVSVLNGVFYAGAPRAPITFAEYEKIAESYPLEFAIPAQLGDSYRAQWPVMATNAEFFSRFKPAEDSAWTFAKGRPFEKEFEVVLGSAAAKATGHALYDKIVLTHGAAGQGGGHTHDEHKYEVVGILEPTGTAHDRALFTNLESSWIIHAEERKERESGEKGKGEAAHDDHEHDHDHDHDHAHAHVDVADLTPADKLITTIYLRVATRPGSDASASMGPVFDALRRDPTLTVAAPATEVRKLLTIVSNVDQILVAMAIVVMLSSGIAIMLALYNSMEQRRRQIAVLRVLGASRGRIFNLVLTESVVIGVMGTVVGVLLAVGGALVVSEVMRQRLGLVIEPGLPTKALVGVAMAAVALSAVAGIVPAIVAYRTAVAKNLRPMG